MTADVVGLFTNIPQEDGTEATREALDERVNKSVPTNLIERLLELVLKYNIFEFDSKLYRQDIGTSMGTKPAPDYSNTVLARKIDPFIKEIAKKYTEGNVSLRILKLFLMIFLLYLWELQNISISSLKKLTKYTMQ